MAPVSVALVTIAVAVGAPLAGSGERSSRSTLKIRAEAPKKSLSVGEPALVHAKLEGPESLLFDAGRGTHLRLLIDRGQGFAPYREPVFVTRHYERSEAERLPLTERTANLEYVLTYDTSIGDFVFPRPGKHRVAVEYEDAEHGLVRSNVLTFDVRRPTPDDEVVLAGIRRAGWQFVAVMEPVPMPPGFLRLVAEHPHSLLLHRVRIGDLLYRMQMIGQGSDPDDMRARQPPSAEQLSTFKRERYGQLLPTARALTEIDSAFTSQALLLLAGLEEETGDQAAWRKTLERIVDEYPASPSARLARARLDPGE